jgi:uracil-DNA glycosylase
MRPQQPLRTATFDSPGAAIGEVPPDWLEALGLSASRLGPIANYVGTQRRSTNVLPSAERVFAALHATPFDLVHAVILGQDPYPTRTHAMGLAFSVPRDMPAPLPRSLKNIHAELRFDLGLVPPDHGSLEAWAHHGVLLLNTTLTVQEGVPGSHKAAGWSDLTDAIISAVAAKSEPVAFLLWGVPAKAKGRFIDEGRHVVVRSAHPVARSRDGFRGTKPFSRANDGLLERHADPIDWDLDD